jgi:uncharacterized protein YggE
MNEARVRQGMTAVGAVGVAAITAAAYVVGSGGGSSAKADTPVATATQDVVTVDGVGQAAGTPDTMITTIGVDTRGATPSLALSSANKTMRVVQGSLSKHGVAAKDQQTTGLSVNPVYVYSKGKQAVHGYEADEQLEVTLRNLSTAGKIISAVVAAGGPDVSLQQLSLDLDSSSSLVTNARAAAFADAQAKAEQYAALAHRTLGPVVSVSESNNASEPQVFASAAAAAASTSVPIAAGSQSVGVDVTVVFSLQ